ncbi:hypothetical protein F8M41_017195 [Gigaspora margarita]|uniref:Uncharacterized protein n=1 Tax=Gigaspora margarita TaxID=4874 RepID=A0A8H4EUD7_GIGMA|nr:hypothetical protein F8M41_017195 [Gigaspora margarita]
MNLIPYTRAHLPEIFYLLSENEQFFSQLQDLSLGVILNCKIEYTATLLNILAKNTTKIRSLELDEFDSDYDQQSFHALYYALICIIKSQKQLIKFKLHGNHFPRKFHGIISALESQKNSLQEVKLIDCDYNAEFEVLKNFKKLEAFRFWYHNNEKLLKILNYKVSTLEIVNFRFKASTLAQILEKSGVLLQRLIYCSGDELFWEESLLLNAIKSFCPNITYLSLWSIGLSTQFLELMNNLPKLQFLSLCRLIHNIPVTVEELKIIVMQFAEILPLTLQYLDFRNPLFNQYVDIFLNHCNAPLKKLLINHLDNKKNTKALIKFCIRKKTLNYVGLIRYCDLTNNIRKDVKTYVTLVPHYRILVPF